MRGRGRERRCTRRHPRLSTVQSLDSKRVLRAELGKLVLRGCEICEWRIVSFCDQEERRRERGGRRAHLEVLLNKDVHALGIKRGRQPNRELACRSPTESVSILTDRNKKRTSSRRGEALTLDLRRNDRLCSRRTKRSLNPMNRQTRLPHPPCQAANLVVRDERL